MTKRIGILGGGSMTADDKVGFTQNLIDEYISGHEVTDE